MRTYIPMITLLISVCIVYVMPDVIIDAILSNIVSVMFIVLLVKATGLRPGDKTGLARIRGRFVSKWETIIINMFWIAMLSYLVALLTPMFTSLFTQFQYTQKRTIAWILLILGGFIYQS